MDQPRNLRPRRPPKPMRRRGNVTIRIADDVKLSLQQAAESRRRSLSEEVETRLEQSLSSDRMITDALALLYGRQLAGVLLEIGDLMTEVGRAVAFETTGSLTGAEAWLSDPTAYDEASKAAVAMLEALRPAGSGAPLRRHRAPEGKDELQRVFDLLASDRGRLFAGGHAAMLTGEMKIGGAAGERFALKQELLGELVDRLRNTLKGRDQKP